MKYLITGGTGSLGKALINKLKENTDNEIYVYSRDEGKHALLFGGDKSINCIIGDIRDYEKLDLTFERIRPDYVIHAAALKRIDDMEFHPDECIKTNINGSENVAKASLKHNVKKCILVSTDKACQPINVYGSSKFIAERIFTNYDYNSKNTIFASVRYGNVIASRGSFIPLWLEMIDKELTLNVTSSEMTRFLFTLEDAVNVVLNSLKHAEGGEVFVPQINSYTLPACINSLGLILNKTPKFNIIGLRPGEKLHEDMLSQSELDFTYEIDDIGISLLQIRPQYTKRTFSDKKKYNGPHFNSALHVSTNTYELSELIKKGLSYL
jgi:UDP-N-acetylglucosamine 4,6-dehydratase